MEDLSRIDWNLLPALDALLSERNVSSAARRTGVSQPAMSNALRRLRRHFHDDLMVRTGTSYQLTALAERLAPVVGELVRSSVDIATSVSSFDPATSTRRFTVAAGESIQATLAPALLRSLNALAPHIAVSFVSPFTEPFRTGEDVLARADGWLAPSEMLPGRDRVGEWWQRWVCVVAKTNTTVGDALTFDDLARMPWVVPTIRGEPLEHLRALEAHGTEPTIAVRTESFLSVPFLVGGSDRIGIVQNSVAERLADAAGVRVFECPWPVMPLRITFWFDHWWAPNPAHTWLRETIAASMSELDGSAPRGLAEYN